MQKTIDFERQAYIIIDDSFEFTDPGKEIEMTISFAGGDTPKSVSSLDIYNSARAVGYDYIRADEQHSGHGTGSFDGPTTANMDTTFTYDKSTKTLKIGNTTVTATADPGSMWRDWEFDASATGHIVKDTVFYGKFVKDKVNVKFEAMTGTGYFDPKVTFDPEILEQKLEVHMDSVFTNVDSESTIIAKANFAYTGADKAMTITIAEKTVMLKFTDPAFDNPEDNTKINEELQDDIETNPYVIKYKIIERTKVNIEANLDGGAFVNGYVLPEISPVKGGKGAWTEETAGSGIWTNSIYEEYEVATLKTETIESPDLT